MELDFKKGLFCGAAAAAVPLLSGGFIWGFKAVQRKFGKNLDTASKVLATATIGAIERLRAGEITNDEFEAEIAEVFDFLRIVV